MTSTTPLPLHRFNPAGYPVADDLFEAFAFVQCVRAGDQLHLSGITPLKGALAQLEIVGAGDTRRQVAFVIDTLQRCLAAAGLGVDRLIALTLYATDLEAVAAQADLFRAAFGAHPPVATWLKVAGLFHPDQQIELTAIAAC